MIIASSDDKKIQQALTEAYEKKSLRGKALLKARRLIEARRTCGKRSRGIRTKTDPADMSPEKLLQTYRKETHRQRYVIKKAKVCETRLLFVVSGLASLVEDERFTTLLRAEKLGTLPKYLAERICGDGSK